MDTNFWSFGLYIREVINRSMCRGQATEEVGDRGSVRVPSDSLCRCAMCISFISCEDKKTIKGGD